MIPQREFSCSSLNSLWIKLTTSDACNPELTQHSHWRRALVQILMVKAINTCSYVRKRTIDVDITLLIPMSAVGGRRNAPSMTDKRTKMG